MAAGKTTVGRALAERLEWEFLDMDREIERRAGRTVPEIFAHDGEEAFRALEAEVASECMGRSGVVIAAGGGWFGGPGGLEGLPAETLTVWLRISPEESLRRASAEGAPGRSRPMLRGEEPLERARSLLAARAPEYGKAAVRVDVEGRSPAEIAEEILRAVSSGKAAGATPARSRERD